MPPRSAPRRARRVRMTGAERREQLIAVARGLFADKGIDGTSVEEIAAVAEVSKPVVYEHFGGKDALYAVVVDREVTTLLDGIGAALAKEGRSREVLEQATLAFLDYIEGHTEGFRILARGSAAGEYATLLGDVASRVEQVLRTEFQRRDLDPRTAQPYAQALVGMVAMTGQWWLDNSRWGRKPDVAAHLVNLAWNGLRGLEARPTLASRP